MSKLIICAECLDEYQKVNNAQEEHSGEIEPEDMPEEIDIKSFYDWRDYAFHIVDKHFTSNRLYWVISCIKDEIQKCEYDRTELNETVNKTIKLLKEKGITSLPTIKHPKETVDVICGETIVNTAPDSTVVKPTIVTDKKEKPSKQNIFKRLFYSIFLKPL